MIKYNIPKYDGVLLVLKIDTFHARCYTGENFVGYCVTTFRQNRRQEFVSKDGDMVALLARYVGDVYHADIHAYVPHIFCFPAIDKAKAFSVSKQSVQPVGITDRESCDAAVAFKYSFATITDAFACFYIVNLQNSCSQGADIVNYSVVTGVYAVKS